MWGNTIVWFCSLRPYNFCRQNCLCQQSWLMGWEEVGHGCSPASSTLHNFPSIPAIPVDFVNAGNPGLLGETEGAPISVDSRYFLQCLLSHRQSQLTSFQPSTPAHGSRGSGAWVFPGLKYSIFLGLRATLGKVDGILVPLRYHPVPKVARQAHQLPMRTDLWPCVRRTNRSIHGTWGIKGAAAEQSNWVCVGLTSVSPVIGRAGSRPSPGLH